ncbi:MAG: hypothetical protein HYX47_21690 [Burkholderiales bacterium]|nr:hypothetical protein [Burkholderiales bacterium]
MPKKHLLIAALLLAAGAAQAQSTPAKKDLAARIIKQQQASIEAIATGLAQQPAEQMMAAAEQALAQRVPADKREAVAQGIRADAKKYLDEAVPLVRERALKLAPTTIGAVLEEKFTEDELKQVVGILESPAFAKFQQMGNDMQRALLEKLVAETRSTIEPKVKALEQSVAKKLGVTPSGGAAPAAPAARPAAKPASK